MNKRIVIIVVSCLFMSCYYDNSQELYGTAVCTTVNISYTNGISEVIARNTCLGCHSGTSPAGGFKLQTYADVKAKGLETRSGTSVLLGALQHLPNFTPMPQGLSQISQCDINKIQEWIKAGMPQ